MVFRQDIHNTTHGADFFRCFQYSEMGHVGTSCLPICCVLSFAFAHLGQIWNSRYKTLKDREQSAFKCYKAQDVPILKSAHLFAFALQAMSHVIILIYAYSELSTTLSGAMLQSYWNGKHETIDQTAEAFSSGMAFVTWFISKVYSIWDLRRFGYIKTRDGLICASSVVAGQFLFGPGATWAGLWHGREGVIVGLQRN